MVNIDCVTVEAPQVGMIFDTWQEADLYYDAYGKQQGHTGLCDFAERYVRAMEHRIEAERLADGNSTMYLHTLLTDFKIEETFRNVYTDAKFVEVQRECKRLMYYNCSSSKEIEEGLYEHLIKDRVYIYSDIDKKEKPINRWRIYRVLYNEKTQEVECECMLFECNGILCRHCINSLESQQIPNVPKKYILDRWRKDIYRKHTRVKVAYHDLSKTEEVLRYDKMVVAFEPISYLASENDEALRMVIDGLQQLEMQIKKVVKPALPMSNVCEALTNNMPHSVNSAPQFCTPSSVGRSVVISVQFVDCGEDDDHTMVNVELPVDGGIKDPPTNRGPGCVRAIRFMTTYEEVCRQKEERRNKYVEKQRRKERAKKKQADASGDEHEMIDKGVARQIDFDHSLSQSLQ
uniref:SWIM-type domain-containing protein n=1 Tax=Chenopodium quinoa TaxID=63459 RepID=A0A803N987_CHEQI